MRTARHGGPQMLPKLVANHAGRGLQIDLKMREVAIPLKVKRKRGGSSTDRNDGVRSTGCIPAQIICT